MQLIVEQLRVVRGQRIIIDDLGFRVAGGDALLLKGPNGAGKTTLLRTLAGFLAPTAGKIRLEGGDDERDLAEQCHFVGHLNGIKASLTVIENLSFWAEYLAAAPPSSRRGDQSSTVLDALDTFGLMDLADIPAAYLSAGQKRRLGLARLLIAPRPVWLLDEPTVSLDAGNVAILAKVIAAHVAGGGIAIAATHIPMGLASARELHLGVAPAAPEAA